MHFISQNIKYQTPTTTLLSRHSTPITRAPQTCSQPPAQSFKFCAFCGSKMSNLKTGYFFCACVVRPVNSGKIFDPLTDYKKHRYTMPVIIYIESEPVTSILTQQQHEGPIKLKPRPQFLRFLACLYVSCAYSYVSLRITTNAHVQNVSIPLRIVAYP